MRSVSVSSCRRCMLVSCVHSVAVVNVALWLISRLQGDHIEETSSAPVS